MKINKKIGLSVFLCLALTFSMFLVMATSTLNTPVTATSYSTTMIVNCTTNVLEPLNATIYYNASGGATGTLLTTMVNDSVSDTEFYNSAVSISSLSDLATYNFSCYVDNGTAQEWSAGVGSVTIDNTAPVATLYVFRAGQSVGFHSTLDYKCSLSDAIDGTLTTQSFSVTHPTGDTPSSTTLTRNYATNLQFTDTDKDGDYVFTCSATDDAGNTATSTSTVTVKDVEGRVIVRESSEPSNPLWLWVLAGALLIYWLSKK